MDLTREKLTPLLRQLMQFGVVGGAGFIVDVGGFNLLRFAGGEGPLYDYPLSAKLASGAAATVVAWVGNRYWTFRHTRREAAHHEFALFALAATLGTLIALGCLWFSHYVLDLRSPLADNVAANGVGLGLAMAFRFWAYRRHVFSGGDRQDPGDPGDAGQDAGDPGDAGDPAEQRDRHPAERLNDPA